MSCELILVSASVTRGEPADCELTFHLDMGRLPKFSVADLWSKKVGNPLRDRLMIEWLFTYPTAQEMLQDMDTKITQQIQLKLPTTNCTHTQTVNDQSPRPVMQDGAASSQEQLPGTLNSPTKRPKLLVGIVCPDGRHYSPCFVEKLYERFQGDKTLNKQLIIQSHHWDITSHSSRKKEHYVWYKTKVSSKQVRHIEILTNNRLWVSLDEHTSRLLELAFREDHYCSSVPNSIYVVDFSTGTLFDKQRRSYFYVRSALNPPNKIQFHVKCRWVGGEGYKGAVKRYDAAGILFYSVHPETGEALFLLGHMTYGTYSWCDFGGLKSWKKLKEAPRYTAARECFEETLGILGCEKTLREKLEDFKTNNVFKVVNEVYSYVSHFLRIPYENYPERFDEEAQQCNSGLEIDEIQWFTLSSMREAVQMAFNNERNMIVSHLMEDGRLSPKTSELRVEFVHTMCIADRLGILDSIEYITKQLHKSTLPPPPKPVSYPKPRPLTSKTTDHTPQAASAIVPVDAETSSSETAAAASGEKMEDCESSTGDGKCVKTEVVQTPPGTDTVESQPDASMEEIVANCDHVSLSDSQPGSEETRGKSEEDTKTPIVLDHAQQTTSESSANTPATDCADDLEADDLVNRSRAWSFEEFVSSLPPERSGEEEGSQSPKSSLFEGLRQRKGSKVTNRKGGKKNKKSNATPTVNGRTVLYYGMGAGTFGI